MVVEYGGLRPRAPSPHGLLWSLPSLSPGKDQNASWPVASGCVFALCAVIFNLGIRPYVQGSTVAGLGGICSQLGLRGILRQCCSEPLHTSSCGHGSPSGQAPPRSACTGTLPSSGCPFISTAHASRQNLCEMHPIWMFINLLKAHIHLLLDYYI